MTCFDLLKLYICSFSRNGEIFPFKNTYTRATQMFCNISLNCKNYYNFTSVRFLEIEKISDLKMSQIPGITLVRSRLQHVYHVTEAV